MCRSTANPTWASRPPRHDTCMVRPRPLSDVNRQSCCAAARAIVRTRAHTRTHARAHTHTRTHTHTHTGGVRRRLPGTQTSRSPRFSNHICAWRLPRARPCCPVRRRSPAGWCFRARAMVMPWRRWRTPRMLPPPPHHHHHRASAGIFHGGAVVSLWRWLPPGIVATNSAARRAKSHTTFVLNHAVLPFGGPHAQHRVPAS